MSIMSLVNLKEDYKALIAKPEVAALCDYTKKQIVSYVNSEVITDGAAKKSEVVKEVVAYITTHFITQNTILNFIIGLLVQFVPQLVQFIYNQLATFIVGLTATV